MVKQNVSRNKINATRQELTQQIEDRRQEREMMKQSQLHEERNEAASNMKELQNLRDRNNTLRNENKQFVSDSLKIGNDKKNRDRETEDILRKEQAAVLS